MVGIVVVSHSADLAEGLAALASQMAGPDVRIAPAGGLPDGSLGTDEDRVRAAIRAADQGSGVVILGDLGSAILTVRHVLERHGNGHSASPTRRSWRARSRRRSPRPRTCRSTMSPRSAEEARGAGKL